MSRVQNLTNQLQSLKKRLLKETADQSSGSRDQQKKSGGIPLHRKLCYAVGGVPGQVTAAAINVSLQIFLLDVVQMEAFYVSMILFVSRAWDAVTDPLVGYLVSRSKWTPIGKLTPWMLFSTPFGVLSYLLMWFMPQGITSQAASVLWFLTGACLFETLMTCYQVPFLSLNMFLGGNQRDRDSATAYRMTVEMVAMLLASVIQGHVVAVYNTEKQQACQQLDHETPQSTSSSPHASLHETQKAFLTSALVLGALFFLCSLVLFLGGKEQCAPLCLEDKVRPSYLTSLKMIMCDVPFRWLVLGFVFSVLAFETSLGNFALFCSHAAGLGAQFEHLLLVLLISASIAVPVWQIVLLRIGKKATVFIGLTIFIPPAIIVACVPSNFPVFMVMCVLMGFSVATIFLLPWSMLPDVVDDFAVRHPSFKDLEPLFFSCYAFCSKLAGGLSIGLSTMTLQFVGYKAGACSHGNGVATTLIVLFSPVPIAFLLIGMVFFRLYPINERQRVQTDVKLLPEASSSSPSDPRPNVDTTTPRPPADVTSFSHCNSQTRTPYKSESSPNGHSQDKKCSVRSSTRSIASSSRPIADVQSNPQSHEVIVSPHQHSGEDKLEGNVPQRNPVTRSSGSHGKSKASWV
ncbi:sodium-dependent lysophosphatidylcholine symporter 1-B-like [Parambassis ranga]|uniref:Sodium-dependent lysophosphatidylcholine symporter 1-B-like n=1 Tax=Parambassis ranga TaxID=210632 RepID=A0A6P7IC62_9TELE|nr:sodium-dependent lysophosphatidylcholine symporter 1-like [Parambassis ranga]